MRSFAKFFVMQNQPHGLHHNYIEGQQVVRNDDIQDLAFYSTKTLLISAGRFVGTTIAQAMQLNV